MGNKKALRIKLDNINDLIPLGDYIVVEAHEAEAISEGGIIIPDKAQKQVFQGTVVAVGPGKQNENGRYLGIPVEPGDVIFYRNFQGWKLAEINDKQYFAICSDERFAKLPKAKVRYL